MSTTSSAPPVSLTLARSWYALLGGGALAITASEIVGDLSPGSVVDVPNLAAGLVVGVLMLAAAGWVGDRGGLRTSLAWVGIVAGVLPFAWLLWVALNTGAPDAIALAAVPTALAVLAASRMGVARARASRAASTAVVPQDPIGRVGP